MGCAERSAARSARAFLHEPSASFGWLDGRHEMVDEWDLTALQHRWRKRPLRDHTPDVVREPFVRDFHNFESLHVGAAQRVDEDVDLDLGAAIFAERRL